MSKAERCGFYKDIAVGINRPLFSVYRKAIRFVIEQNPILVKLNPIKHEGLLLLYLNLMNPIKHEGFLVKLNPIKHEELLLVKLFSCPALWGSYSLIFFIIHLIEKCVIQKIASVCCH